jgi:hypothetical protein
LAPRTSGGDERRQASAARATLQHARSKHAAQRDDGHDTCSRYGCKPSFVGPESWRARHGSSPLQVRCLSNIGTPHISLSAVHAGWTFDAVNATGEA